MTYSIPLKCFRSPIKRIALEVVAKRAFYPRNPAPSTIFWTTRPHHYCVLLLLNKTHPQHSRDPNKSRDMIG
ncbi:unnamed protein product [Macrosiphum euphorbiae]|uniref:Uncharacterized protein n=1 Tax=Macrosiphum euphorbiae TaxID=13131 RepID=A0AAV0WBE4_9HEMI|nr:unnamed protein product [Macrosiphum euphorbiae]